MKSRDTSTNIIADDLMEEEAYDESDCENEEDTESISSASQLSAVTGRNKYQKNRKM